MECHWLSQYLVMFLMSYVYDGGYAAEEHIAITFNGDSRVSYDVTCSEEYRKSDENHLAFKFKTIQESGLILFADGYLGDYFIVELVQSRLHIQINLGSSESFEGGTTLKAGSLLDDNQWHDVKLDRTGREVNLTLDGKFYACLTSGSFVNLDLDRPIHFGGLDNFLEPVKPVHSTQNFSGCLSNLWYGSLNVIQGVSQSETCLTTHGDITPGACQMDTPLVFGFTSTESYLRVARQHTKQISVTFEFRTIAKQVLLLYHQLMPSGHLTIKISKHGHLLYAMQVGEDYPVTGIIYHGEKPDVLADGLWHSFHLDAHSADYFGQGSLDITVDSRTSHVKHILEFSTTSDYFLGANNTEPGFVGCMRNVAVQEELVTEVDDEHALGVLKDVCSVEDRCEPNPCEHGGICSQDHMTFMCNCADTGYQGATCHRSRYPVSCADAKALDPDEWSSDHWIDLDGSGPLDPFKATCIFNFYQASIQTQIHHDAEEPERVDGYQEPGSYRRLIRYGDMYKEQFDELIRRADSCQQYIKFECHNTRLLADPGYADPGKRHYSWWVGRTNQIMDYWGGASPKSAMCGCAVKGTCVYSWLKCNCESGEMRTLSDEGYLSHKEDLPVMELRFGDTGAPGDSKWGEHSLGPLVCQGDAIFDNIVTFRKSDATISLPTFTKGDIQFQFKTTQKQGVFLQNTGDVHFIDVRLIGEKSIQFQFDVDGVNHTLVKRTKTYLSDDSWHSLYVEINGIQATLQIDQEDTVYLDLSPQKYPFTLELTSPLVVGASVDYKDGYIGCIRRLLVNGLLVDLRGMVEQGQGTYGVSAGCQTKCSSQPCLHGGQCVELYSHYSCNCANTALSGHDCGKEVGVNLDIEDMIKFELDESFQQSSSTEDRLVVGFSTLEKRGLLMMVSNGNHDNHEYITISMNNNGGVKVSFDVGTGVRHEVNTFIQDIDLANTQQHVVVVKRYNKGRSLSIAVDDYPVTSKEWDIHPFADNALDNPKYLYIGKDESTRPGEGFKGCIYRVEFNGFFPLKEMFADKNSSSITIEGGPLFESTCLLQEVVNPPEEVEYRP